MFKKISKIKLNSKQNEAFSLMKNGENVFVTGCGGTGKTELIKIFSKNYKLTKNLAVTSTTGTSSLLINGTTMHSYLGIGFGDTSTEHLVNRIYSRKYLIKRWNDLEILIIDEISMLKPDLFDKIEHIARIIKNNTKPFGGIQIILSGDFLQLPPVKSKNFCFNARSWKRVVTNTIVFTEIIRQEDLDFKLCLNQIRIGNITTKVKEILNSCLNNNLKNKYGIKPTKLYSLNRNVDKENNYELDKLANDGREFFEYEMIFEKKNKNAIQKFLKNTSAKSTIQLCLGAQVILLKNLDLESGLANGSRGIITNFINDLPLVKFLNGIERIIGFADYCVEENNKIVLKASQVPLKLGYACTIHSVQGGTLDYVEIDLSNIFSDGQAYVALSRVKNLKGLSLVEIDYSKIKANATALKFYNKLE